MPAASCLNMAVFLPSVQIDAYLCYAIRYVRALTDDTSHALRGFRSLKVASPLPAHRNSGRTDVSKVYCEWSFLSQARRAINQSV